MNQLTEIPIEVTFSEHKEYTSADGKLAIKCIQKNNDVVVHLELQSTLKNNDGDQIVAHTTLSYDQVLKLLQAIETAAFIIERGIDA